MKSALTIPLNSSLCVLVGMSLMVTAPAEATAASISPASQSYTYPTGSEILPTTLLVPTGFTGTVTYAITPDLSAGLLFDSQTGIVNGTPTASQATTSYTITGTDTNNDTATTTLTFTILAPCSTCTSEQNGNTPVVINNVLNYGYAGLAGSTILNASQNLSTIYGTSQVPLHLATGRSAGHTGTLAQAGGMTGIPFLANVTMAPI